MNNAFPCFVPCNSSAVAGGAPAQYLRGDEKAETLINITTSLFASGERITAKKKMTAMSYVDLLEFVSRVRAKVNVLMSRSGVKPELWMNEEFPERGEDYFSSHVRVQAHVPVVGHQHSTHV